MLHSLMSWHGLVNIIGLVFLLLVFRHFWQQWQMLNQARYWLITQGRITQLLWTRDGNNIWPTIEYTYQVYDSDFIGEYFFLDTSHNNPYSKYARAVAYRAAIAFKNNEEIDVFYNPNNPLQSALDVSIPLKLKWILGFLLALIVTHVVMMVLS